MQLSFGTLKNVTQVVRNASYKNAFYNECYAIISEILDKAYREACMNGTTTSYRAKLDIIGHTDVGKTSLSRRLLGKSFKEQKESTEGTATHEIHSQFSSKDMNTASWEEKTDVTENLVAKFSNEVLMKYKMWRARRDLPTSVVLTKDNMKYTKSPEGNILEVVSEKNTEEREEKKVAGTKAIGIKEISSKTEEQLLAHYKSQLHITPTTDIDYSLHLWDYGGHTEFLATHHLFMNIESTILILLDVSKNFYETINNSDKGTRVGIPCTSEKFLHYWLDTIHCQAIMKQLSRNIALVLTHKDMIRAVEADHYIGEYISKVKKSLSAKPYSKYITNENIFVIDNKNGDENDFEKLRKEIFRMVMKQRSWGIERPVRWLKLEADILDKASEKSTKHLEISEVMWLASAYGIDEVELQSFLNFHHILGDFIHFAEPNLKDIVITNPQWLADMFKTLITSHEFISEKSLDSKICQQLKHGRITLDTLENIWKGDHVQFLVKLFQGFDLLLPIVSTVEGDIFIVPCMLPHIKKTIYETNLFKAMVLCYNSEFQPQFKEAFQIGIFHRLLSQCSKKWKICADDHLSYTDASFEIAKNVRLVVTLQNENQIRVSVWCRRDHIDGELIELILESRAHLKSIMNAYHNGPCDDRFLMLCPHAKPEEKFTCLVKVKEVLDPKTSEITLWSIDKCLIHKKDVINYESLPPSDKLTPGKSLEIAFQ